jgi:hypothetical protein
VLPFSRAGLVRDWILLASGPAACCSLTLFGPGRRHCLNKQDQG